MPAISYSDFSGGLDRRLSINSQDANKLWVLRNAYVTLAKRIRKRPGLKAVAAGLTGSVGLKAISGTLYVFTEKGTVFTPPSGISKIELDPPPTYSGDPLTHIYYADIFQGFPYVVGRYVHDRYRHHYVDASPSTEITDANCPHRISVTKAASRIYAIDGEVVRYCAAGDARDWTTASDAGFLPVALQQDTKSLCTAVGTFQGSLVVLFSEGAQIWNVAVDPSANAFSKAIAGVGTRAPVTLASFFNDLVFLSPFGFRSMTVQAQTDRIDDRDVGVPVDSLVVQDIATITDPPGPEQVFSSWIHELGQYWAVFNMGTYSKAWVYTYSRESKIACWSEYTFDVLITAMTTLNGKVYMRTEDQLFEVSASEYTDNGQLIDVEVQMAFQDAKSPGVAKQFYGGDYVVEGEPTISFKYDTRDQTKETVAMTIPGDTRPGDVQPVEVVAPVLAPVFRHSADGPFSLDAATFYYHLLGLQ